MVRMLDALKSLIDRLVPPPAGQDPAAANHTLELAAAVMLVEVMRADGSFDANERQAVAAALREKFALDDGEAARLAERAEVAARESTDLFAFTSVINERFDLPRKLRMVELMWHVAYADGRLREHERHVMWRIADLLHVPHAASMHARLRAQQAAGVA
jgi:uncharacterized tellurite resistance protein B-like protein